MRKLCVVILCLAVLFAVVACGQETEPEDTVDVPADLPPPPPPPAAVEEPEDTGLDEAEPVEEAAGEILGGEDTREHVLAIEDVRCTAEGRKLSFTLTNMDDQEWQMNQEVPFPPPIGMAALKFFVNNYEANGHKTYYDVDTGDAYFGPNERFSDNCGGVEVLAPGESTTCSLEPVPLKQEDQFQNKNHLFIDTPGIEEVYSFTCV